MRSLEIRPGVRITNDKCLVLDDGPTVVIGDLHLGYERALEQDGLYLPRLNTGSIRDALNDIMSRYEPERVVLLGDVKHDFRRAGREEREQVRGIVGLIAEDAQVVVVKGNHDNYIQNIISDMGILAVDHIDVMGYRLEHGHEDSGVRPVIIGHEHPSVRIPGAVGGGMKIQCFVHAEKDGVIVIPPFSPFSSGNDLVLDEQCVMAPALRASDYAEAEIYGVTDMGLMDLGTLRTLSDVKVRAGCSVGRYIHFRQLLRWTRPARDASR
ncbi:MAG: metallophosphoesterase [Thermoplasmata archaeon]|nr:metallophosphoesterase [Thermoplasmata archaeon]